MFGTVASKIKSKLNERSGVVSSSRPVQNPKRIEPIKSITQNRTAKGSTGSIGARFSRAVRNVRWPS